MGKVYVGDEGTVIQIDMQEDISDATTTEINMRNSEGDTTWTASVENDRYLKYTTITGDLDVDGTYLLQPYLEFPSGWKGKGETVSFEVYEAFK